jgi:NTP pyrophosphatase (non-canonical NTP hydrolase)
MSDQVTGEQPDAEQAMSHQQLADTFAAICEPCEPEPGEQPDTQGMSTPEPPPIPNDGTPIWELVIADMHERDQFGRAKYKTPLQAHNGRDSLADAYQEVLDLVVYIKQQTIERKAAFSHCINEFCRDVHARSRSAGWWATPELSNIPTKLCLIHSEISEAMEGHRKDRMDDHLPHRKMIEVELADAMIRIGDLAGALGLDLGRAITEKMEYNLHREDHKQEVRNAINGKKF